MKHDQDPITNACRLLREAATELQCGHTLSTAPHDWTGEPEAKAAYDEHHAAADALEAMTGAVSASARNEPMTRFCPGCGFVGEVEPKYRDCCPDGSSSRVIPAKLAAQCHDLFQLALGTALAAPAQPAPAPTADATVDTFRLDWLDAGGAECVFHLGSTWYTRASYGQPYRKCSNLRDAIDAAIAAQQGGAA